MKLLRKIAFAAIAAAAALGAQPGAAPVVDLKGIVKQTHIGRGQGMPYLDVEQGGKTTKVYLGSMRYLIAENFNPKAGQEVVVKGYRSDEDVVAIEVSLPKENKTLRLRDNSGRPLWRGGPGRGNRGRRGAR